jgi:hypothetical protein
MKKRNDMWNLTITICPTLGGRKYWYQRTMEATTTIAR